MVAVTGLFIFFIGLVLDVLLPQNNKTWREIIYLSPAIGGVIAAIGLAPLISLR